MSSPSKPIPGSSGEVLTTLPSAYLPHAATGLLHLPRFLAKAKYVKEHGALPASYAKNYKRGMDRFLCLHLGIDPAAVEKIVLESSTDAEIEAKLAQLLPSEVRAAKWNRDYVQKGMTASGREFSQGGPDQHGLRRSRRSDRQRRGPDRIRRRPARLSRPHAVEAAIHSKKQTALNGGRDFQRRRRASEWKPASTNCTIPANTNRSNPLPFCHREGRDARRGDPAGLLRRFAPRTDREFHRAIGYNSRRSRRTPPYEVMEVGCPHPALARWLQNEDIPRPT
ncbi:MAG: DUF5069 domain-containing protein [Lacunisphaera sp.]